MCGKRVAAAAAPHLYRRAGGCRRAPAAGGGAPGRRHGAGTHDSPHATGIGFGGQYVLSDAPGRPPRFQPAMTTRRTTATPDSSAGPKLRQTQAEYTAARPHAEPGVRPMMSSSKMYVCIRCHANFKTGDGKPDPRLRGLGRCNTCLGVTAPAA